MSYRNNNFRPPYKQNYGPRNYGHSHASHHQQPPAKKSGASYTKIRKGNFIDFTIVNAWNKSKKGMITATVAPYHKTDYKNPVVSDKGHEYVKMMAIVTYETSGHERKIPCLMNIKTNVISLEELGMCITPNGSGYTSSGKKVSGYFGTFTKS